MAQNSSNKILIIIIVFLLLILIGGGSGVFWYMQKDDTNAKTNTTSTPQEKQVNPADETLAEVGPLYPLAPITVNLKTTDGKDVYLKATLSLELNSKLLKNELDAKNAVIRDEIILILSNYTQVDVFSDRGKREICEHIKEKLNSMLHDGQIRNVYIVSFIIQ